MSEISKYEAQKKKLDGLCEEHDLTYRFRHDVYPITLTVRPLQGVGEQLSLLAAADEKDYISPDASMVIYRKDGELAMKINGTFTISEALRLKLKNIYIKMSDFWREYFFREVIENKALRGGTMPVIDEDEAEDEDAPEEEIDEDEINHENDSASDEDLIAAATLLVRHENKASCSLLQRRLKLGYSRAVRLMDELEKAGVVGPLNDGGVREVLPADVPED